MSTALAWTRANLFGGWSSSLLTLALLLLFWCRRLLWLLSRLHLLHHLSQWLRTLLTIFRRATVSPLLVF